MNEAVETAGKNALETRGGRRGGSCLGRCVLFRSCGNLGVAAEPGDRDGVQGAVEVSVAAIRLSRCRVRWPLLASSGATPAREANAASLRTRPRWDQLTRSWAATTGPTPGSASSAGPAGCCGTRTEQLDIQLGGLVDQEPDPSGDRAKRSDRDPMLNGGSGWAGEPVDPVQLLGQPEPSQPGSQMLGCDDDQALQFVDRLGPADQNALSGDQYLPKCLPESAVTRSGLMLRASAVRAALDGVDPVVLGAAGALVVLDLNDVFTRPRPGR